MLCWARTLFILVVLALGTLSLLGACGQKGPLYLPADEAAPEDARAADVPVIPPETRAPESPSNLP